MNRQFCRFEPVGACTAISKHSVISSGATAREVSRRRRTALVVVSTSSALKFQIGHATVLVSFRRQV